MKFIKIEEGYVPRYVNFDAVRFLWIEDFGEDFCERNGFQDTRYHVLAEHDVYLRSFSTHEEAQAYLDKLVAELNEENHHVN